MQTLLRTQTVVVRREGGRLVIRRRVLQLAIPLGIAGVAGGLFYGLWRLSVAYGWREFAGLGLWGTYAMFGVAAVVPLAGLLIWLRGPTVLDAGAQTLRHRRRVYPFGALARPRLETTDVVGIALGSLTIDADGVPLRLLEGVQLDDATAMKSVLAAVRELLALERDPAPTLAPADARTAARDQSQLVAMILLAVGVVWAGAGYFAMPGFVLTRHDADFGFLFWPLGIWIAGAGAIEALGAGVVRRLRQKPRVVHVLVGILWLAPYFVLCYRAR